MTFEFPSFDLDSSLDSSVVLGAVIYWPCQHRYVRGWWHRLRGQRQHGVASFGNRDQEVDGLMLSWKADGTFRVEGLDE